MYIMKKIFTLNNFIFVASTLLYAAMVGMAIHCFTVGKLGEGCMILSIVMLCILVSVLNTQITILMKSNEHLRETNAILFQRNVDLEKKRIFGDSEKKSEQDSDLLYEEPLEHQKDE